MTQRPSHLARFLAELGRRHVFRATGAYAVGAFVVLQLAEIIVPAFGLGDQVLALIVIVSALGFPVVTALAWVYEITPSGIRTMQEVDDDAGLNGPDLGSVFPRLAFLAVTVLAVGGAGWWWIRTSGNLGDDAIRSLAVLPLESFAADGDQDYFAAGMHEAIISQLTQLGLVRVISRASVVSYDRAGKSMAQIGEELGVEGVVEGSVLVDDDQVRITVQLIHARSDTHLWAQDFEREMTDVIALQREVSQQIAMKVQGELEGQADAMLAAMVEPVAPVDPEAAMEEMKGRAALVSGDLEGAASHFQEAIRRDPTYVRGFIGLAGARMVMGLGEGEGSRELLASADEALTRALALDPNHAEVRELGQFLDGFRIEAGPRGPALPAPQAPGTESSGRETEAEVTITGDRMRFLVHADSVDATVRTFTDWGNRIKVHVGSLQALSQQPPVRLRAARNYEEAGEHAMAVELLQAIVENAPTFAPAWDELEHLYVAEESFDEVLELRRDREAALGSVPNGFPTAEELERALGVDAIDGYWRWRLDELKARSDAGAPVSNIELATAHAALGDFGQALVHLTAAAEQGDRRLGRLWSDPVWDAFRNDTRFFSVIRELMARRPRGGGREGGRGDPRGGRRGGPGG